MKRQLVKPILISLVWSLLIIFDHEIDMQFGGWVHFVSIMIILILTIVILVKIVQQLIFIIKQRQTLSIKIFLPLIIYIIVPALSSFCDIERLRSPVVLRACYKGTQSQMYILFRKNAKFEANATSVFFYDEWYTGSWKQNADTISLDYNSNIINLLGRKVLVKNQYLIPVGNDVDTSLRKYPLVYLGYCKGNN